MSGEVAALQRQLDSSRQGYTNETAPTFGAVPEPPVDVVALIGQGGALLSGRERSAPSQFSRKSLIVGSYFS